MSSSVALVYVAIGKGSSKALAGWRDIGHRLKGSGSEGFLELDWDCSSD